MVFACNAEHFAIAFLFSSLSLFRQCFWTDELKQFVYISTISALGAFDQYRTYAVCFQAMSFRENQ